MEDTLNLGELRDRAQARFRDVGGFVVSEDDWDGHINSANRYFLRAARWPFTSAFEDLPIDAGTRLVHLTDHLATDPSPAEVISNLENLYDLTNDGPLRLIRQDDFTWRFGIFADRQKPGKPVGFKVVGNSLHLIPPPKVDISLRVYYFDDPDPLTDDLDEPVIPERFQEALVVGAVAKASIDDQNFDAASKYQEEFDTIIDQARQELIPGTSESVAAAAVGPPPQRDNLGVTPDRR